jgi:hypothetical protein
MAGFHTKTFLKYDDYMTPKYAWENINRYMKKDTTVWEPFYGDGSSGRYLTDMGCDVIHEKKDFFKWEPEDYGYIYSNPPYSCKKEVLTRLKELGKPFIMIMPSSVINTQYVRKLFSTDDDPLQIIIPRRRIQFIKLVDGTIPENFANRCNFDCFYYCWKMDLPESIVWLE